MTIIERRTRGQKKMARLCKEGHKMLKHSKISEIFKSKSIYFFFPIDYYSLKLTTQNVLNLY